MSVLVPFGITGVNSHDPLGFKEGTPNWKVLVDLFSQCNHFYFSCKLDKLGSFANNLHTWGAFCCRAILREGMAQGSMGKKDEAAQLLGDDNFFTQKLGV